MLKKQSLTHSEFDVKTEREIITDQPKNSYKPASSTLYRTHLSYAFEIIYNVFVCGYSCKFSKAMQFVLLKQLNGIASIDIFEDWDSMFLLRDMYFSSIYTSDNYGCFSGSR